MIRLGVALLFFMINVSAFSQQADTLPAIFPQTHSPQKAAVHSAVLPGWGQAYNQKYWKIPVAYGLIGGALYFHIQQNKLYQTKRADYQNKLYFDQHKNTIPGLIDPFPTKSLSLLSSEKQHQKNQSDLGIILMVLAYGLQIADATVDAHLFEFNVSDDLSLKPSVNWEPATKSTLVGLSLKLR
jgi:hypothetical protein